MSKLRFVCPTRGKEIDTGIETDAKSFQTCRGSRLQLVCPHCNALHDFRVEDGRIDELHVA